VVQPTSRRESLPRNTTWLPREGMRTCSSTASLPVRQPRYVCKQNSFLYRSTPIYDAI
jgi:hypothetical protein